MIDWIVELEKKGIESVRIHLLESEDDYIRNTYGLSTEENIYALEKIFELEKVLNTLTIDLGSEIPSLLLGDDTSAACTFRACDPYTTAAVRGIEGDGSLSNCGRTNKEGIDFLKSETDGYERYLALYHTPQEFGGCKGCRFFVICKGQCPGTAINGDWRNRTEYCNVWKFIYERSESDLISKGISPISKHHLLDNIERTLLDGWQIGENRTLNQVCKSLSIL